MSFFGFLIAMWLLFHFKHQLRRHWRDQLAARDRAKASESIGDREEWPDWDSFAWGGGCGSRHRHRHRRRHRHDRDEKPPEATVTAGASSQRSAAAEPPSEEELLRRAHQRAKAETGFYIHLMWYLAVIALLALINMMTTGYPWFLWPALGWGFGIFSHYMAVFGAQRLKEQFFDPVVERELRREKAVMTSEKQASIDELSSTIAHEIRNPIAAAKSLVQQMGEDPASVENVEYGRVALEELDRVEHSIAHLLKYAKEEDLNFQRVNLANVVDSALTQLRAKLEEAKVAVARNYIAGPTVEVDPDKLRQVFANILDNAIDALAPVAEGRRIELWVENGRPGQASVRLRDNGGGIAPDKIDRIFNPFFTTKEKGTGLGMAISKKIVEAHQGSIHVASTEGSGSEFTIMLPLPR
jgi:signal transduction histidine kinase